MKTANIHVRPDRLNFPLPTIYAGRLSSAVVTLCGDIPDDVEAITIYFGQPPDGNTPRDPVGAAATRQTDGTFRAYCAPFLFPEAATDLQYDLLGLDSKNNPRWLGGGTLQVLASPAEGSSVVPPIVPPDTYIRNPATGLYHKLTATADEDGNITVNLADEGVER